MRRISSFFFCYYYNDMNTKSAYCILHMHILMCGGKNLVGMYKSLLITKVKKITEIVAWFTKLLQKQFHLSIYGMSVISNVSNLAR